MRIPEFLRDLSSPEFIELLRKLPKPVFVKVDDDSNRDPRGLPKFVDAFDDLCNKLERLPTQDEYSEYYIEVAHDFLDTHNFDLHGIENRARRNYPSFLREYQLYFLVKDAFPKSEVVLSKYWDQRGIDLVITNSSGLQVGICSFTGTFLGRAMRKVKDARVRVKFPVMALTICRDDAYIINGFWCYGKNHINEIKEFMKAEFNKST